MELAVKVMRQIMGKEKGLFFLFLFLFPLVFYFGRDPNLPTKY